MTSNIPWGEPGNRHQLTTRLQEKDPGTLTGRPLQDGHLRVSLPPLGQETLAILPKPNAATLPPAL